MKKIFTLFLFAGMMAFLSCGPSAEEKAAIEKAKQDSIAAVKEQALQDSLAAVQAAEEARLAEIEKARQDSIAQAQAAAKVKKTVKKVTAPVEDKTKVKAGQGKG